jgi:hypothetical protein
MANVMSVAQGGYQGRRVQRPNTVHLLQALTRVRIAANGREPWRHLCNGRIECAECMCHALEQRTKGARKAMVGIR